MLKGVMLREFYFVPVLMSFDDDLIVDAAEFLLFKDPTYKLVDAPFDGHPERNLCVMFVITIGVEPNPVARYFNDVRHYFNDHLSQVGSFRRICPLDQLEAFF